MITVSHKNQEIKNQENKILLYPKLFAGPVLDDIYKNLDNNLVNNLSVGLATMTEKIYTPKNNLNSRGSIACILLQDESLTFTKNKEKINVNCIAGDVLILGALFRKEYKFSLPDLAIYLYEENYLPSIYLNIKSRLLFAKKINNTLSRLKKNKKYKGNCPQKYLNLSFIGKGSYANVFKSGFLSEVFAVKMSKLKPDAIKNPFNYSFQSWHEVFFLQNIIKKILEKNICPNLPLVYETFSCEKCEIMLDDVNKKTPCSIIALELANSNLKTYLLEKRSTEELESCLFQIMAALHSLQIFAQILNFDIKKENILIYNVLPGGYWVYKIRDKEYYVPNYGKMFILNDFGLSRPMSPKYPLYRTLDEQTYRLGSRYAIIRDNKFYPLTVPLQKTSLQEIKNAVDVTWQDDRNIFVSKGAEFRMYKKDNSILELPVSISDDDIKYLDNLNITTDVTSGDFFMHPEIIPPFEFYNDTQDVIRMFTGGKRTTQRGNHKLMPSIPKKFIKNLQSYVGKGESMKDGIFSTDPSQVLAGYFIESFFGKYRKKPKDAEIIGRFTISI